MSSPKRRSVIGRQSSVMVAFPRDMLLPKL